MDNRPPPRPVTTGGMPQHPDYIPDGINSSSNKKNTKYHGYMSGDGVGNHGHFNTTSGASGGGRRQVYANRSRTLSSGSTRGAFGIVNSIPDAHYHPQQQHYHHTTPMYKNSKMSASEGNLNGKRDEETGKVHPLYRIRSHDSQHSNDDSHDTYRRVPSPNSNRKLMYDRHMAASPNYEDHQLLAQKEHEIQMFASMAAGEPRTIYASTSGSPPRKHDQPYGPRAHHHHHNHNPADHSWEMNDQRTVYSYEASLGPDLEEPSFVQGLFRKIFYDPVIPEFTTLQQTTWAVLLGVFMGLFTAGWGYLVEKCVDFVWVTIPKYLMDHNIFTDLNGHLPLPHYIWICPAIFGGVLSYITAKYAEYGMPIPGQNEWIESLHCIGVMDYSRFFPVIILSTLGMASGLSLGPEMPLVLSSGMVGSWLALKAKQSVLSARVMNLVAASAAIGGFFGFPMAGALFVLELPHRMGLQYFEALSPCVISSIISVITNRLVTKKYVTGYFTYPFLTETLPSDVYYEAVIYGLFGTVVGILYADLALWCKNWVHHWFQADHSEHEGQQEEEEQQHHDHEDETTLLMVADIDYYTNVKTKSKSQGKTQKDSGVIKRALDRMTSMLGISHEPTRAAVAGVVVGIMVGLICMFLPHQLFWGEAQLQTLIDKGKTPLPVFEYDGPTADLTRYGYCMIDHLDARAQIKGFSTTCVGILAFTKILTIGLSLGTGICGGHFWGPLYVGCAAGHFFSDIMAIFENKFQLAKQLATFPCVSILCVMGSSHVVTYRCHMAIVLVLTLTITSFTSETKSGTLAGDYSAIFPLLVVACFVPLAAARGTTFYAKQRCRGDISATTWVLSKAMQDPDIYSDYDGSSVLYSDDDDVSSGLSLENESVERTPREYGMDDSVTRQTSIATSQVEYEGEDLSHVRKGSNSSSNVDPLAVSVHSIGNVSKKSTRSNGSRGRSLTRESSTRRRPSLSRGSSFGVEDFQPTLFEQSRAQASSVQASSRSGTPVPSIPRGHRRKGSNISIRSGTISDMDTPDTVNS